MSTFVSHNTFKVWPFLILFDLICLIWQGDAGSALIRESDKTVLGAFSFLDIQTCASGFAVGFSRIGPYVDWINQIMSQKLE